MVTLVFTMAILVLLLVLGVAYYAVQTSMTPDVSDSTSLATDNRFVTTTGAVNRITVSENSEYALTISDPSGEFLELKVKPATVITETLVRVDGTGSTTNYSREVNVDDISIGTNVEVAQLINEQSELSSLISVRFTTRIEEDIQTYLQTDSQKGLLIKGSWANYDSNAGTFSILREDPNLEEANFRHDFTLPESGVLVYKVEDLTRLNIEHAHEKSLASNIEEGDIVQVSLLRQELGSSTSTIKAIFIE
jgi:hypothetical protein